MSKKQKVDEFGFDICTLLTSETLDSSTGDINTLFLGHTSHYYFPKRPGSSNNLAKRSDTISFLYIFSYCWDLSVTFCHNLSSCSDLQPESILKSLCSLITFSSSAIFMSSENHFSPLSHFSHTQIISWSCWKTGSFIICNNFTHKSLCSHDYSLPINLWSCCSYTLKLIPITVQNITAESHSHIFHHIPTHQCCQLLHKNISLVVRFHTFSSMFHCRQPCFTTQL